MNRRWTIRVLELGRTACELILEDGIVLCLEVYDGGGHVASHGLWRIGGKLAAIVGSFDG